MNDQSTGPVSKWFPAILLQNFVAFPLAQERVEGTVPFSLPLRVGRKESVTSAEDVKGDLNTPVAIVTVMGDPVSGSEAFVAETGVLCLFNEVISVIDAGPPCYDLAAEGVGRVTIETVQLHSRGLFVARLREMPVSHVGIDELPPEEYRSFLDEATAFLEARKNSIPLVYSEEQFGERLYPKKNLVHAESFSADDVVRALRKFRTVSALVDIVAQHLSVDPAQKQKLLDDPDAISRFRMVLALLRTEGKT